MNLELIKPGHTYYAPVEVVKITNGDVHVVPIHVYQPEELVESPNPYRHVHSECSSPELTKLLKIKRGDKVKVVERFGFKPWAVNWDDELEPSEDIWDVAEVDAYGFAQISRPGTAYHSVFFVFLELVTANDIKNTETAPKYDPCRKFREGDIVEPCQANGRWSSPVWEDRSGIHYEVTKDEDPLTAHMDVKDPDSPHPFLVHAAFFKLVTPVEEQERYIVEPSDVAWFVVDKKNEAGELNVVMYMCALHPHAKEAAEAECARLNAEYRKEVEK